MVCMRAGDTCASCPLSGMCRHGLESRNVLGSFRDKQEISDTSTRTPIGHDEADRCLRGGLQHGVLHEVFSDIGHEAAATGFVAGLVSRVIESKYWLWIRQDFAGHEFGELSPIGLLDLGFDPARMILLSLRNANDELRAAHDALSCSGLGAVVVEVPGNPKSLDLTASRRLTLAAMKNSVTPFLLRLGAQPGNSAVETRWRIRNAISSTRNEDWGYPCFEVSLIRNRHGKTGHWFMEWNCDDRIFQTAKTDYSTMVSATAN